MDKELYLKPKFKKTIPCVLIGIKKYADLKSELAKIEKLDDEVKKLDDEVKKLKEENKQLLAAKMDKFACVDCINICNDDGINSCRYLKKQQIENRASIKELAAWWDIYESEKGAEKHCKGFLNKEKEPIC
jgi:hypothetical protein